MDKVTVESQIILEITKRIRSGIYAPDTFLPPLIALSTEFHTSSTTISKALNAIRKKGLLKMIRGKGTRVLALNERSQNGTVGIVVSLSPSLFSHEPAGILEGFRKTLKENRQHYRIVLESELNGILHSDQSLGDYFGGLLFIEAAGEEKQIEKLKSLNFPYVVANLESPMEATCTWVNHKKTTKTAVIMLAAMGHKKIALISRDINSLFYKDAFEGYKTGLTEAGLIFDDKLLIISDFTESLSAYHAVNKFLNSNEMPDAFVACRDYLAYGICKALTEKNNYKRATIVCDQKLMSTQTLRELRKILKKREISVEIFKYKGEMNVEELIKEQLLYYM